MGLFKSLKKSNSSHTNNEEPQQSSPTTQQPSQPPPYAPPSYTPAANPPPSNPPPYHDWQSFTPDTSTLPPPPSFHATHPNLSSTHNASYHAAAAGHAFCASNPPFTPSVPAKKVHAAALAGRVGLLAAPEFKGVLGLKATGGGKYGEIWHAQSSRDCPEASLISELPMYFAAKDMPLSTEAETDTKTKTKAKTKTIYYETRILGMRGEDAAIAVGFAGKPYPSWRLPGWHRGSVGVHGDDGRRFVNDSWGGIDFVRGFREGETVGVGLRFGVSGMGDAGVCRVEAFFTRNGRVEGRWWLDEERDAERDEGGIEGLQGEGDLYLCVGCFGGVEFEVVIERGAWLYKGDGI